MRNWVLSAYVLVMGCGDNSRSCGTGTKVEGGFCVPSLTCGSGTIEDEETGDCVPDGTHVCTNGTRFDPVTGSCQIDPASCQDGTVLIDGSCIDPAGAGVADLLEGPEPNGLNIIEASVAQAGNIVLKPSGAFVVRGTLAPRDGRPDVDTYRIVVGGPTLLDVSVDGVGGVATGFAVNADVIATMPIARWRRFGLDLGSDTSVRQIYLPASGPYRLAVGDARVLFEYAITGAATTTGASGTYFLSVKAIPVPPPTPVAVPSTTTSTIETGEVGFYQGIFVGGPHPIRVAMPSELALAAMTFTTSNGAVAFDEEDGTSPAEQDGANLGPLLITVDNVFAVSAGPVAFTLTIQ